MFRRRNIVDSQVLVLSLTFQSQFRVTLHADCDSDTHASSGVKTLPAEPAEMMYSKKYTAASWKERFATSLRQRQYICLFVSPLAGSPYFSSDSVAAVGF